MSNKFEDLKMANGMTVKEWRQSVEGREAIKEGQKVLYKSEYDKMKDQLLSYINARCDTLTEDIDKVISDNLADPLATVIKRYKMEGAVEELKQLLVLVNGL